VETKYYKKIAIFRWWDKLMATLHKGKDYIPAITLQENYSVIIFAQRLMDWLGILREIRDEFNKKVKEVKYLESENSKLKEKLSNYLQGANNEIL
jgi:hypothetical protein